MSLENRFMLLIGAMKKHTKLVAPALYHPDGGCRIHTVDSNIPELRKLLLSFKAKTGLPFIVNTSLNLAGMPIAETLEDALLVLRESDLDGLVINHTVIMKQRKSLPKDFAKMPEVCFQYGDKEAEKTLNLLYPGWSVSRRSYFGLHREYCDWLLSGT